MVARFGKLENWGSALAYPGKNPEIILFASKSQKGLRIRVPRNFWKWVLRCDWGLPGRPWEQQGSGLFLLENPHTDHYIVFLKSQYLWIPWWLFLGLSLSLWVSEFFTSLFLYLCYIQVSPCVCFHLSEIVAPDVSLVSPSRSGPTAPTSGHSCTRHEASG